MTKIHPRELQIGIDIGGTFTDFIVYDQQIKDLHTLKVFSTPSNPALAVIQGLEIVLEASLEDVLYKKDNLIITHGSTVATNALLEGKGAKTALITTRGFRDVIQIGRQNRPSLYSFSTTPPQPLVPETLRFEVDERIDSSGNVLEPLKPESLQDLESNLKKESIESVGISLLFSFLHPEHEKMIADRLRERGFFVSVSSEILPEYREFERTSTTVVNAYVSPILDRYLGSLEDAITKETKNSHLRIMQSNGGIICTSEARSSGVRCILSGPAGGVVGAAHIARNAFKYNGKGDNEDGSDHKLNVITIDMGGTSTDVSLIDDVPSITTESVVGGYPIQIPMIDIHTIGAGGGSIASIDLGGALRVGPKSAGADPGPACYARGDISRDLPTVTDANLVLGRLQADHFLAGRVNLDTRRAVNVMARLGEEIGLNPIQIAKGVIDVVDAHMERALRLISIQRGYDPNEFVLLSFGGAGGLHACNLAHRLGVPRVIIPPLASTLSAYGMLVADVVKDYSKTIMLPGDANPERIMSSLNPLIQRGITDVKREGFSEQEIHIKSALDMRYRGQSYEITIPYRDNFLEDFHKFHEKTYGFSRKNSLVEIVNIRVRAEGKISPPPISRYPSNGIDPGHAFLEKRPVHLSDGEYEVPLYHGELLTPGNLVNGPAIVVRKDTTIFLDEQSDAQVDQACNLMISIKD